MAIFAPLPSAPYGKIQGKIQTLVFGAIPEVLLLLTHYTRLCEALRTDPDVTVDSVRGDEPGTCWLTAICPVLAGIFAGFRPELRQFLNRKYLFRHAKWNLLLTTPWREEHLVDTGVEKHFLHTGFTVYVPAWSIHSRGGGERVKAYLAALLRHTLRKRPGRARCDLYRIRLAMH